MKKVIIIGVFAILAATIFAMGCLRTTKVECETAEDCVPAQCCHPTECIHISLAPNCEDVVCTMECRPGTMDCGQGYCDCIDGECQAIIESPGDTILY